MEWLFELLKDPTVQSLASSVAGYLGTSTVDAIKDALKDKPIEYQMFDSLEKALDEAHERLGWERDRTAISQTFFAELGQFSKVYTRDGLRQVLAKAVGQGISDEAAVCWITCLNRQLAVSEHSELRNYLEMEHILDSKAKSQEEAVHIPFNLTPNASVWKKDIIGRDDMLKSLFKIASEPGRHVQLTGMGGIGKTELLHRIYIDIVNYPKDVRPVDHIAFISYNGSLDGSLSQSLGTGMYGEKGDEAAWDFLRGLCADKNLLMLIDDITPEHKHGQSETFRSDSSFQKLKTLNASVVFASRSWFRGLFEEFLVESLLVEDCITVFSKSYGRDVPDNEKSRLRDIIENRAGRNTLVVERLGSITRMYSWNIAHLDTYLKQEGFKLRSGMDEDTLQLELNKLYFIKPEMDECHRNILEAFSLIPALALDIHDCVAWMKDDANMDELELRPLLSKLAAQTWLVERRSEHGESVSFLMHQIVAASVLSQYPADTAKHAGMVNQCVDKISWDRKGIFIDAKPYLSHAVSLFQVLEAQQHAQISDLAVWIGRFYRGACEYSNALFWYQKAFDIREKALGGEHPSTANIYNNIAVIYDNQGDYAKALEFYQKDLAICEKALGTKHPSVATTYNNIAIVYSNQLNYPKALEWHQRALAIREEVLNTEHPDTAATYNNIATVYHKQGNYQEALKWCQRALAIWEKSLGAEHPNIASSYNNIAVMYGKQGDDTNALELHQRALAIKEKVLGTEHPDTATSYNNIAVMYGKQGDDTNALEWHKKALAIYEKVLGPEHPDTVDTRKIVEYTQNKLNDLSIQACPFFV